MSLLEHFRELYEYEIDCNQKMLAMLESVPEANRRDTRFQKAVTLADHLAAGREKWLDYMTGTSQNEIAWWNPQCDLAALRPRFAALESRWTHYLTGLDETGLAQTFEFAESNGESFRIPVEVQMVQLFGHASYHRGQITLLVDDLGGEAIDTDYADWCWARHYDQAGH